MFLVVLTKMKGLEEVKTTCVVDVHDVDKCPSMMAIKVVIVAADDDEQMMVVVIFVDDVEQ